MTAKCMSSVSGNLITFDRLTVYTLECRQISIELRLAAECKAYFLKAQKLNPGFNLYTAACATRRKPTK